jgi:hypothetical protein
MRTGSDPVVALQNIAIQTLREDTVCIQTCKRAFLRVDTCCPVYKQRCEAAELLFGNGLFRRQGRLTGFGSARNIIRIRTKWAGGEGHDIIDAT